MKSVALLTFFLLNTFVSFCQSDTLLPIKVKLKLIKSDTITASKKGWEKQIKSGVIYIDTDSLKLKTFDIEVTIANTSQDSIYIWLMKCSSWENFLVNNDYIFIRPWNCDANFPDYVGFKAGESKVYKMTLEKKVSFDYPCKNCTGWPQTETTKLGLIIIDDIHKTKSCYGLGYDIAMGDKSLWKIVWSNPIYLFGPQPKPKTFGVYGN